MKTWVHVNTPEELREGDTFCGKTVATRCGYGSHLWWSDEMTNMDSDAKLLSAPFKWHPGGFEVERECGPRTKTFTTTVTPESYIGRHLAGWEDKRVRVTIEEIEEIGEIGEIEE